MEQWRWVDAALSVISVTKKRRRRLNVYGVLERVMGVEPTYQPWEGRILPMNYTRKLYSIF